MINTYLDLFTNPKALGAPALNLRKTFQTLVDPKQNFISNPKVKGHLDPNLIPIGVFHLVITND